MPMSTRAHYTRALSTRVTSTDNLESRLEKLIIRLPLARPFFPPWRSFGLASRLNALTPKRTSRSDATTWKVTPSLTAGQQRPGRPSAKSDVAVRDGNRYEEGRGL